MNTLMVMEQALKALESLFSDLHDPDRPKKCVDAIAVLRQALTQLQPPPECKTDAEKVAFAHGWWRAMESKNQQQKTTVESISRQQFITNMCLTWRHDYGLTKNNFDSPWGTLSAGMTDEERQQLVKQMQQLFDNCIAPYLKFEE